MPSTEQMSGIQSRKLMWTTPALATLLNTLASMKNQKPSENWRWISAGESFRESWEAYQCTGGVDAGAAQVFG